MKLENLKLGSGVMSAPLNVPADAPTMAEITLTLGTGDFAPDAVVINGRRYVPVLPAVPTGPAFTDDDIRRLIERECGPVLKIGDMVWAVEVAKVAMRVQREACAKVCEDRAAWEDWNPAQSLREVAAEIRGEAIRDV